MSLVYNKWLALPFVSASTELAEVLENRESNITTQLASIFKAFEDCRLVQQIREEIEKVKQINVLAKVVTA